MQQKAHSTTRRDADIGYTSQKMKFSIKYFSRIVIKSTETAKLGTFFEKIIIGKLHFLRSGRKSGSFPLSNDHLDDVLPLKHLLGLSLGNKSEE